MSESFLSISNGTLEWSKGVEVLRDLNLNLPSRKLTFIAGPCGAGKTTLLSAMLGELELAKGCIEWSEYVISPHWNTPWENCISDAKAPVYEYSDDECGPFLSAAINHEQSSASF